MQVCVCSALGTSRSAQCGHHCRCRCFYHKGPLCDLWSEPPHTLSVSVLRDRVTRPSGQSRGGHNTVGTEEALGAERGHSWAHCCRGLFRGPQERFEDNETAGSWRGHPGHTGNSPMAPAGPKGEAPSQPPVQHPVSLTNTGLLPPLVGEPALPAQPPGHAGHCRGVWSRLSGRRSKTGKTGGAPGTPAQAQMQTEPGAG